MIRLHEHPARKGICPSIPGCVFRISGGLHTKEEDIHGVPELSRGWARR